MSSSTITEYQVRENRLRDELAVKAALREASVLEHRLHGLHSQVKQARQLYPEVSENLAVVDIRRAQAGLSTRAAAEAYRKELAAESARVETEILAAMCRGESLAYLKRSGGAFKGRTAAEVLRPIENARSEERGRAKLEAARQEMVKVVSDVLAFVRVPTEMFATLRQYADGMIKLDDPRSIDLALTDFRAKANEANNKYLTSLRQHKELAALRSELVELEGENIEAVRAMLDRVEKGQISITSSIRSTVKKARDQALQDGDRRYVATVMKQKLRDLGYQCDEDFETLFMDGGHIHIDVPDRNEPHVVELDVDPESNVFGAKVMRVSDKTEPIVYGVSQEAYETIQVEVKWCKDLANMLRALKDGGIECGIEEETFKDVGVKGTVVAVLPPNEKRRGRQRARGHVLKARELKNQ